MASATPIKDTYYASVNTAAAAAYVQEDYSVTDSVYVSTYIRFPSFPASTTTIVEIRSSTALVRVRVNSDGTLRLTNSAGTTIGTTSALSTGTIYRIGLRYSKGTGANAVLELYLATGDAGFGAAVASTSTGAETDQSSRVRCGSPGSATVLVDFDDLRIDDSAMPGPSGSTEVNTSFTASVSFQGDITTTFTAAASFQGDITNDFSAAASFASTVDTSITAAASFINEAATEFTATASFSDYATSFTAAASFAGTNIDTAFTAAASFGLVDAVTPVFYPIDSHHVTYEVRLVSPNGVYEDILDMYGDMSFTLTTNDIGVASFSLPSNYPFYRLRPDTRIEIWRGVGYRPLKLQGDTQFLVQTLRREINDTGNKYYKLEAASLNHILKRRVVAYNGDLLNYTETVDYADDMMKLIVDQNFGTAATDTARRISGLSIASDLSLGPTIGMAYAHKNVLDVLRDIANVSFQQGTPLFFDIVVKESPNTLEFRTFITTRGVDRRSSGLHPLVLGYASGAIGAHVITEVYGDEITYVYCAGPGEEDVRGLQPAEDTERSGRSPFGRRELWVDFQDGDDDTKLLNQARAELIANRPKKIFEGKILQTGDTLYDVHWGWGDYVTVDTEDDQFDCFISGLNVQVASDGKENIEAALRSDT